MALMIGCIWHGLDALQGTRAKPGNHLVYIISEETSIFAPQRLPFYMAPGVAACTVGKLRASTGLCVFVARFDRRIFYYS